MALLKKTSLLSIFYIAIIATSVHFIYPRVDLMDLSYVIALLGIALSITTHKTLEFFENKTKKKASHEPI